MIRPAARPISRLITSSQCVRASRPRRLISTAPPAQKSRSWKNRAVRFGIAATIIYYYNTTNLFAEGPELAVPAPPRSSQADEESDHPTLSEISAQKQKRKQASSTTPSAPIEDSAPAKLEAAPSEDSEPQSAQEMEDEASQQGAFNPETGEINWDCPCLGGMANGPCGEEFKTAFSCFVYSTEEPKGVDCIDKFKGMQDCFRKHPDIYGDPDAEDDDEEEGEIERAIEESTDPGLQPESRPQPVASLASAGKNVAEKAEEKVEEVIKSHKD